MDGPGVVVNNVMLMWSVLTTLLEWGGEGGQEQLAKGVYWKSETMGKPSLENSWTAKAI